MQVILKPVSHPELEEIIVTHDLFAIGRHETPFCDYEKSIVAKLSKRHARLFAQDGKLFLADLGSLNGTACNGQPIKHALVEVKHGDELGFGRLTFEVNIIELPQARATQADEPANLKLVLTPERQRGVLEPIVISSFPFLINKQSEILARYKEKLPKQLHYVSRRHAHIFARNGKLLVEDLGSTNGTFVNGEQLDEHAHVLEDGDVLAFGSDQLVYQVHILTAEDSATTKLPDELSSADGAEGDASEIDNRTIFVDSATSFIDVYFVGEEAQPADELEASNGVDSPARSNNQKAMLARELKRSFFGAQAFSTRVRWGLVLLVTVTVAGGAFYYWQAIPVRTLETALAQDRFYDAVLAGEQVLEGEPDDKRIAGLATEAAVKHFIPRWIEGVDAGDFVAANQVITEAQNATTSNVDDDSIWAVLDWSTGLLAFMSQREGDPDPNRMFTDDEVLDELLTEWQSNNRLYSRELGRTAQIAPQFEPNQNEIFRNVRLARALQIDLEPVQAFKQQLHEQLGQGSLPGVTELVDTFLADEVNAAITQALRADVIRLERLLELVQGERWLAAYRQLDAEPFVTDPFQTYAAGLPGQQIPDAQAVAQFAEVESNWRDGSYEDAIAGLNALLAGRWSATAEDMLAGYQRKLTAYRSLIDLDKDSQNYADRVFDLYQSLAEGADAHMIAQLEGEFQNLAQAAVQRASGYARNAERAWRQYEDLGRIQTTHRLEGAVTPAFRQRAAALSTNAAELQRAAAIYARINRPLPAEIAQARERLRQELRLQRNALENLSVINEPVRRAKLQLIPALGAD